MQPVSWFPHSLSDKTKQKQTATGASLPSGWHARYISKMWGRDHLVIKGQPRKGHTSRLVQPHSWLMKGKRFVVRFFKKDSALPQNCTLSPLKSMSPRLSPLSKIIIYSQCYLTDFGTSMLMWIPHAHVLNIWLSPAKYIKIQKIQPSFL